MADDSRLLAQLAGEFSARLRQGEQPGVDDYVEHYPHLAERIRALFPTLMLLQGLTDVTPSGAVPQAAEHLAPGAILGPYRIEREIGRGGMGVVYEAVHQVLDRRIALKVLRTDGLASGGMERFLREAQTAAGLHHTNIVPVFDLGQVAGVPYYAMQLIAGRGLDRVLRDEEEVPTLSVSTANAIATGAAPARPTARRAPVRQVVEWGVQAADGLAYAHQRGVIHRDIKPSNLILDDQGIVWITDFGLARRVEDVALTRSGALLGTPRYMSPEQAQAARLPVDRRTDIYSLGATLYELATGQHAFDAPSPLEVVLAIIDHPPVPPRRLAPDLPRDLETIILKAMAKRPADRYQDAADLAEDLRRCQRGEPIRARRIGPVRRLVRWSRRNPVVAGLLLTVLVTLTAGIGVASFFAVEAHNRRDEAIGERDRARRAEEDTRDHFCRGLFEQARALRGSTLLGRRWKALELLQAANDLRVRERDVEPAEGVLPSLVELRSEALAALLQPDARLVLQLPVLDDTVPVTTLDGRRAALHWAKPSEKKGGIRLVDLASGQELSRVEDESLRDSTGYLALNRDATLLALSDPAAAGVELWDMANGKSLRELPWPKSVPAAFANAPTIPRFVPGRNLLAAYRCTDARACVVVWDLDDEEDEGSMVVDLGSVIPGTPNPPAIAFSPDGKKLAIREGETSLLVLEVDKPEHSRNFELPLKVAPGLVWAPTGRLIAMAGIPTDALQSTVLLWDVKRRQEQARCEGDFAPGGTFPMAFHPDGSLLAATCTDGSIRIFTTANGKEWLRIGGRFDDAGGLLQWSADGRLIWAGPGGLFVWEVLRDPGFVSILPSTPPLTGYDLSRDSRWLANYVNEEPGRVLLIERATGRQRQEWPSPEPKAFGLAGLSFTPDSKRLVVVTTGQAVVLDLATRKETLRCERPEKDGDWNALAVTRTGHVWTTTVRDQSLVVWDITDRREVCRVTPSHLDLTIRQNDLRQRVLSPAARWLLLQPLFAATTEPHVLYDASTGKEVLRIEGPAEPTTYPGPWFSQDEQRLAIWQYPVRTDADARLPDRTIKIVAVPSGKVLLQVHDNSCNGSADFTPDGRYLILSHYDGSIRLWDIDQATEVLRWQPAPGRVPDWVGSTPEGGPTATSANWHELYTLDLPRLRRELAALKLDW
jgi:serine/threonine protein kinase/WD40 repeat protein